jgi:hypothetical protein
MTTNTSVPDHLTLESVKQAFDDWRNNRKSHSQKTPTTLVQQVTQLLPHYRQRLILSTLRISHKQLCKFIQLSSTQDSKSQSKPVSTSQPKLKLASPASSPSPFVKAFLPPPVVDHSYQVEWQRPDGAQLIIKNLDSAGLTTLIQQWRA